MKRIAFVNQRYGLEVNGGSEYYTRLMAERLAKYYEVDVLTTKAVDYTTWKDWYVRDVETINGVTVRRFSVAQERAVDFDAYNAAYLAECEQGNYSRGVEKSGFEKQGHTPLNALPLFGSIKMNTMPFYLSRICII